MAVSYVSNSIYYAICILINSSLIFSFLGSCSSSEGMDKMKFFESDKVQSGGTPSFGSAGTIGATNKATFGSLGGTDKMQSGRTPSFGSAVPSLKGTKSPFEGKGAGSGFSTDKSPDKASGYEGSSTADRVSTTFEGSSSSPFNMMKGKESAKAPLKKDSVGFGADGSELCFK